MYINLLVYGQSSCTDKSTLNIKRKETLKKKEISRLCLCVKTDNKSIYRIHIIILKRRLETKNQFTETSYLSTLSTTTTIFDSCFS